MIHNRFSSKSTMNTTNNNTRPDKTLKGIHDIPIVFVDNIMGDDIMFYLLHLDTIIFFINIWLVISAKEVVKPSSTFRTLLAMLLLGFFILNQGNSPSISLWICTLISTPIFFMIMAILSLVSIHVVLPHKPSHIHHL